MLGNLLGLSGVILVLVAYGLLASGRCHARAALYLWMNLAGSLLIASSLYWQWNLAGFLLNISWSAIAVYGLMRRKKAAHPTQL